MSAPPQIITVSARDEGLRLDQLLAARLNEYSRSQITAAIRSGAVQIQGAGKKSSYRVKQGEEIVISSMDTASPPSHLTPQKIDFPLLYEDNYLLVLSKPPGLVVHPGSGNYLGTLAHGLLYHCQELAGVGGDTLRPGIVHRLDKDTSGVMVVAKQEQSHRLLVDMFANHRLEKEYLALVCALPQQEKGEIIAPIGRHPIHRQKMAVVEHGGRYAASFWQVQQRFTRHCLLKVRIETGRTHQIRVHLASRGLPIAGDLVYGGSRVREESARFPRQMLHAHRLSFRHPITGETLDIQAEPWPDMAAALQQLEEKR